MWTRRHLLLNSAIGLTIGLPATSRAAETYEVVHTDME
jgi:hypothetical protein